MADRRPIGIFDSGIGGLTVAHAVSSALPNEQLIYFGDTAHLPYGDKSAGAITAYSERISQFLIDMNCKAIVVGCNSAASVAFDTLSRKFGDTVLLANVIDPVVEEVAFHTEVNRVGVIGTKATIRSNAYEQRLQLLRPDVSVSNLATPLLVPMIEEGFFNSRLSHTVIEAYLKYPDFQGMDALILACTHYPLIRKEIKQFLGNEVAVFDSGPSVARKMHNLLSEHNMLNPEAGAAHQFYVSDYTDSFEQTTRIFYGNAVHLEHRPIWKDEIAANAL